MYSHAGATECTCCPSGAYAGQTAQPSCVPVPAGYAAVLSLCASSIAECDYGTYSSGGATNCLNIPAGYSTNGVTSAAGEIFPCPSGYYSEDGAIECIQASAGCSVFVLIVILIAK